MGGTKTTLLWENKQRCLQQFDTRGQGGSERNSRLTNNSREFQKFRDGCSAWHSNCN